MASRYFVRLVRSCTYEMEISAVSATDAEEEVRSLVSAGELPAEVIELEMTVAEMPPIRRVA